MSPPPLPNNDRYLGRYSPDSRYDDYPTDLYETETDFSPPRSPEPYRRERSNYHRNYSPSPPPKQKYSKGSNSSDKSSILSSDEWDRRTF